MSRQKRIGVLTSGGDCAGLNAVLRAVVHRAVEGYGWQVVGIHNGTAGLLARPVSDTMKRAGANRRVVRTEDREGLWHALTPQMFRLGLLRHALEQAIEYESPVTDEASAMELAGHQPLLVEGHADNIKITRPEDLSLAAYYLQQQATP